MFFKDLVLTIPAWILNTLVMASYILCLFFITVGVGATWCVLTGKFEK